MRRILRLVLVGALIAYSTPAFAAVITGNDLLSECNADRSSSEYEMNIAHCVGYIMGSIDQGQLDEHFSQKRLYCMPRQVTAGQLKDVLVAWMRRHPEKLHFGGAALVTLSMVGAFPCSSHDN